MEKTQIEKIHTDKAPAAVGPYSQVVKAGGLLFASGQIAIDPATGALVEGGIAEQAEQCCKNVEAILAEAGLTTDDVVRTMCFLADIGDFAAFNEVYAKHFRNEPARSCVAAKDIPKGALCEIEVTSVCK